jgi:hypothetical protein
VDRQAEEDVLTAGVSDVVKEEFSHTGPKCPYCGYQITADEAYFFDEYNYTEEVCGGCDREFKVEVFTQTTWTTRPVEESEE